MRVVLDSNVIVAAYAARGLCNSVFEYCLEQCTVIISEYIITEIQRALQTKFLMPATSAASITDYLRESCQVCSIDGPFESLCRDPDDDPVIALAVAQSASYLVTGDADILALKSYNTVSIITPRDFWLIARDIH